VTDHLDQRIRKMLSDVTAVPVERIHDGDRLREDLGLDSVGSMELLSMIAEDFDLDISMEEAMQADTVGLVVKLAEGKLNGTAHAEG
jgi:acyl carrier protein